jgi:molybdenum cofactor guanylyltransferase
VNSNQSARWVVKQKMQTTEQQQVTALILAGGRGSRMGGQDKGLTPLLGKPMIEYILEQIAPQVDHVMINANRNLDKYQRYGHTVISDNLNDYQGPLAGFAAGLDNSPTELMITLPCDGPTLPHELVSKLLKAMQSENADIVVAHDGKRLQPVYALLKRSLLPSLNEFLANGDRKIDLWYPKHRMTTADFSEVTEAFNNVNTPQQQAEEEARLTQQPLNTEKEST